MDETIPITRPQQSASANSPKMPDAVRQALANPGESIKRTIPTFTVELPSKGHFYPENSPLSSGTISLYEVTAKHEDILSNTVLLKKGTVLDEFLRAVIATPGVSLDDLLVGDKNAVFLAARISAYGNEYKIKTKCPVCGADDSVTVDLNSIIAKPFDFSNCQRGQNQFTYTMPISGKTVVWKLISHKDESAIDSELKMLAKLVAGATSPEITTRIKYSILSIDGKTDRSFIKNFVDTELSARDSLSFRTITRKNAPDMDMTYNFTCKSCGHEERMQIPLGANFFWPGVTD